MASIYYLAALGAALCWSSASILARSPVKEIGEFAFIRIRMIFSFFFLSLFCFFTGRLNGLNFEQIDLVILSGLVGIFLGDSFLFACLRRLGPRRTQLLFSFHAPFTAILGYFFYSEVWNWKSLLGFILICIGVFVAISNRYKTVKIKLEFRKILFFAGLGLSAALCQAIGVILLKPVFLLGNKDPILVSTIRIGVAALALLLIRISPYFRSWKKLDFKLLLLVCTNGFVAMVLGMTLLVFALVGGHAGIVATLAATAPIIILPLLWIVDKKIPNLTAWLGAILAVVGCFFIFN